MKKPRVGRKARLQALKNESDLAERDLIRRLLALPPEKRTNFLRKRIGYSDFLPVKPSLTFR